MWLQVVVVGATLSSDLVTLASSAGWLRDPVTITVGKVGHVPSSLKHRCSQWLRTCIKGRTQLLALGLPCCRHAGGKHACTDPETDSGPVSQSTLPLTAGRASGLRRIWQLLAAGPRPRTPLPHPRVASVTLMKCHHHARRFVVCDASRHLAVLVRMLRQDMQQDGQDSGKPARTMVFAARWGCEGQEERGRQGFSC